MQSDDLFPVARPESADLALASLGRLRRAIHEAEVLVRQGEHRRALQALAPIEGFAHTARAELRGRAGL